MANDRRTKKIAKTHAEIAAAREEITRVRRLSVQLSEYRPATKEGQDAQGQALQVFQAASDEQNRLIETLKTRLEVEMVAMLAEQDTDFEEPTPASALSRVS